MGSITEYNAIVIGTGQSGVPLAKMLADLLIMLLPIFFFR
jgi:orotate phosphoribosyltransferase-like protein